ncbi:MAG TPA: hypothetical protein P5234_04855 [Thermoanaerobaculaceae bacterium]|nr:hypothetical protein [Thermoanaerobaculaceae bacterium]HRS15562.1 hypothetical protein [Thermoanaerobaculaceae bacterium]
MAKAFVAGNMAAAQPYYQRFPQEPVGGEQSIAISSVHAFPPTAAALFSLLRRQCSRGETVLIVAHSSERGVALRLVDGSQFGLDASNVNRFMRVLERPADRRAGAEAELVRDARLEASVAASLLADIAAVRALGLAAVHFRGCNLGVWEDTLQTFRRLLGCQLVTGLALRSAYASLTPTVLGGNAQARARAFDRALQRRSQSRTVIEGEAGARFGYRYTLNLQAHTLSFSGAVAESAEAVAQFIRRHLPAARPPYTSGPLPIHALLNLGDLVYPYENGRPSSAYTFHLRSSRTGDDTFP